MAFTNNYSKRKITDINPASDYKVKIFGLVIDKRQDAIMVDDGTGKVKVFVDLPVTLQKISVNQFVAVFGSALSLENGFDIRADIIQDMTGLDINIYKKVDDLYRSLGV